MKNILTKTIMSAALVFSAALVSFAAPKSEAQFDRLIKTYTLNPDGSQELRVQKQLTIYTHAAMNSLYGETFIVYDPSYQHLTINESYTRQKDGTVVTTPDNAFVEVLPSAAADAPAYNGLKEMVVVHTGLELGATIYLDYTITTEAGALPALDIFEQIEELSPIKNYVLSVSVPAGTPLHYELLNGRTAPRISEADGMQTVTWTLKNVRPRPRSLAVSVPAGNVQAVAVTTFPSREAALEVISSQAYSPEDEAVRSLLDSFNEGKADRRSVMDKINDYVVSELGLSRLSLVQTGYRVRPAADVIGSAYATSMEKALLADALMKAAGQNSEIALVFPLTEDRAAAGLSSLMAVSSSPVCTDWHCIDLMSIGDYVSVCGLDGKEMDREQAPALLENVSTMSISAADGEDLGNGYYSFAFPAGDSQWLRREYASTTANTTRSVNLLLSYLPEEILTYTLAVGEGLAPVVMPGDRTVSNSVGTVSVKTEQKDGATVITKHLKLGVQLITPALYPQYYRLMSEWYTICTSPLIFKAE